MTRLVIDPGQLSLKIDILRKDEQPDGSGGLSVSWILVDTVWAALSQSSATVSQQGQQDQEWVKHRVLIRHHSQISSGWKLVADGREFQVVSIVDPDATGRYLELTAIEVGR